MHILRSTVRYPTTARSASYICWLEKKREETGVPQCSSRSPAYQKPLGASSVKVSVTGRRGCSSTGMPWASACEASGVIQRYFLTSPSL